MTVFHKTYECESLPKMPSPWAKNRSKKLDDYEEAVEKCRKEWPIVLERTRFSIERWYSGGQVRSDQDVGLLLDIMERKISDQTEALKRQRKRVKREKRKVEALREELNESKRRKK